MIGAMTLTLSACGGGDQAAPDMDSDAEAEASAAQEQVENTVFTAIESDSEFVTRCVDEFQPILEDALRLDGFFNDTVALVTLPDFFDVVGEAELSSSDVINFLRPRLNYLSWADFAAEAESILADVFGFGFADFESASQLERQTIADTAAVDYDAAAERLSQALLNGSSSDTEILLAFREASISLLAMLEAGRNIGWFNQVFYLHVFSLGYGEQGPFVRNTPEQMDRYFDLVEPLMADFRARFLSVYEDFIGDSFSRLGPNFDSRTVARVSSLIAGHFEKKLASTLTQLENPNWDYSHSELNEMLRRGEVETERVRGDASRFLADLSGVTWVAPFSGDFLSPDDPSAWWNREPLVCERL